MLRALFAGCVLTTLSIAQDEPPVCLDNRLKIELVAENPDLVTPTGIDVDHLGRVFVIESNTHFPPEGYQGHPTDRVLVLENAANPPAKKVTVFADGLTHTMSVAVEPIWLRSQESRDESPEPDKKAKPSSAGSGLSTLDSRLSVFIATRNEILLLTDTDGDLKADERQRLVHLETAGNYPHNGLAGFAFDALGNMFFGFGENLGADYKIIGSDGTTLSGDGEGGNLYRCKPDGSKLERWATGFWNPHASCFDAFGRLFTVNNDADSRPPCRLLHIIPGGDYGYRFRNGRKGTHPFTSWNGEIPGTLPMVAGTGEAPSGIVCYENDGFPADYLGTLLVGSWGDHRIDQFVLEPKGASFTSKAKPLVKGGENFRPVGLAVAPDGSLYFSDWVLKDYKLHGKGRVWRVSAKDVDDGKGHGIKIRISETMKAKLEDLPNEALVLDISKNLSQRRMVARTLAAKPEHHELLTVVLHDAKMPTRSRVEALWALAAVAKQSPTEILGLNEKPRDFLDALDDVTEAAYRLCQAMSVRASFATKKPAAQPKSDDAVKKPKGFNPFIESLKIPETARAIGEAIEVIQPDLEKDKGMALFLQMLLLGRETDPFLQFHAFHGMKSTPPWKAINVSIFQPPQRNQKISFGGPGQVYLLLMAREKSPQNQEIAKAGLQSRIRQVRFAAIQWVGEEKLSDLRPEIEALLADPTTMPDLFLACLATLQLLDGKPASEFEKQPPTEYVAAMVKDKSRPAVLRATALRMLPPNAPELDAALLSELLSSPDESLRTEAARTLASSQLPEAREFLLKLAANPQATANLRAEAIAGLCRGPHEEPLPPEVEALLLNFARGEIEIDDVHLSDASQKRSIVSRLQLEALRKLRGRAVEGDKIRKVVDTVREAAIDNRNLLDALDVVLNGKSRMNEEPRLPTAALDGDDPLAGRRVFFHHNGPLCAKCHVVQGRGGQVGPDLTVIARMMDREKLLASILEPSKEIAPQFTTWVIESTAGKTHTGFILEDNRTGQIKLGTPTGEVLVLNETDIETREPSKTSVMPEKLHQQMTTQELRDLLAFLETLK